MRERRQLKSLVMATMEVFPPTPAHVELNGLYIFISEPKVACMPKEPINNLNNTHQHMIMNDKCKTLNHEPYTLKPIPPTENLEGQIEGNTTRS